jgi:plasmid maintenance system antidote protein VapI
LYFSQATAKGMSIQEVIDNLDISDEHFDDFLSEKVSVDIGFAKRLELVTGMSFKFWLRIQNKFDDSHKAEY